MRRVYLLTLGCPKNTVSSKRIEQGLLDAGIGVTEYPNEADAIVVNTCGFIEAAVQESIDCLLELGAGKVARGQKLIAIGCLAERYGKELAEALPELDGCLGFGQIDALAALINGSGRLVLDGQARDSRPYSYLEITTGCDHDCSFCVIPKIHGSFSSRPTRELADEARKLVAEGSRELVLIGQETGSYGRDLSPRTNLPGLFRLLERESGADWLRVLYLQWYHVTDEMMDTMSSQSRICEYLDIPVQHASADIVKAMNRRGNAEKYLDMIHRLRRRLPDIALRTSIIVGFPGETDNQLLELADFLREAEFDYVGVFEFSAEEGARAASFPGQVHEEEKRERAAQIRELADRISRKRRERWRGRVVDVLVETVNEGDYSRPRKSMVRSFSAGVDIKSGI
jgi:ribosomal protein S12 methylthiotransferase